jgi:glycosyltransferase involved in cell wall biosynthesis
VFRRSEIDVSVVVPVFNTGEWIEACIESLINQSLPSGRYEIIFVDDGSTDETPQRLDELAATTKNVTVFHEPNSGWPGRPRNVGIDNARGRYVFFCDHDDWLEPEALQRMVAYADETAADVLIPKMVGHRRTVPRTLFMKSLPDARVTTAPLMSSLTPHKMFRRSFLNEVGLRFPEGKRRLEDHVFVITAYFKASKIAVLADRSYYHHIRREDDANAAFDQVEPAFYYKFVREVIDTIEANTEPGPERQTALDRPFNGGL